MKKSGLIVIDNIIKVITRCWDLFLKGMGYTLLLSAITVIFGVILGFFIVSLKRSKFKPLKWIASAYIEILRGTPLLLQLFFFYLALPAIIGVDLGAFFSIAFALCVNSSAYVAEIIRAGIEAVDIGQTEAARSLGMSPNQTMFRIVLPQAIKNILPALGNEFIMVIKETSLASTFFIGDLMTQYKTISGALFLSIEPLIVVGVIYLFLTYTLSKGVQAFERRLKASD